MAACEKYLPREVASWDAPMAGMFVRFFPFLCMMLHTYLDDIDCPCSLQNWIKINHALHPLAGKKTLLELEEDIFHAGIDHGVLTSRGSWFRAEADFGTELFFRSTFAAASAEQIDEAIKRFGEGLRDTFGLKCRA